MMSKNNKYTLLLTLFYLFLIDVVGQELPPVRNFTPKNYHAQNQNWAISQGNNKTIYVANNSGLLSFDGAKWKLYKSPNETIFRSVKVIDNKIYTGCYMEFGYWQHNQFNELEYTSLSKKIKHKILEDEQFWNILQFENKVLFQSLNNIYIYDVVTKHFNILPSKATIVKLYKTKESVYFQKTNQGLFKIEKAKEILVSNSKELKENKIVNVFKNNKELLILTQDKGFFKLKNNVLIPWKTALNTALKTATVYSGVQLKDNNFALGTISNGFIFLSKNGELQYKINQKKGLNNNTVLSVFEDTNNDIWLGLDNGVSLVNQQSPFKIYNDFTGDLGSVYASIIYNEKLYLGTNQGLFFKKINSTDEFKFIKNTQGQVWNLRNINETLFCGHNSGTFIIKNEQATKISKTEGTWDFKKIDKNKILQGNYNGLYILEKHSNSWKVKNKIKGFNISSRFFEFLNDKQIFVSHEYKGVLKLMVNDNFTKVESVVKQVVDKGMHSSLVKYRGEVLYAYKNGVYKYSQTIKKFKKDTILSTVFNDGYVSGKLVVDDKNQDLWVFSKASVIQISPSKLSDKLQINRIPLSNEVRKGMQGYENILKVGSNSYLLSATSGFIFIDVSKFPKKKFAITLNNIETFKNKLIHKNKSGVFANKDNNIKFSYNVTEFDNYFTPLYQYRLKELHSTWSSWSAQPEKLFENLPPANYEFLVRAKVGNKLSANIASYKFEIKKPWYLSNTILFCYALSVVLFYILLHNGYRNYYKKQQQKIIEQNKKELKLAQVENEKEIIRIKNEKLRKDFKSKSKELASSIMSIVKKNELLTDIRNQIAKVEHTQLKPVMKLIDKSLKQNDDWEFFQEAFNNADSEFLKRIKEKHPKLSPNDLKLCAYLRLNLSSKEIAPLFNISPRSVEIKRYRLRKKMNLQHQQNLVDYILNL